MQNSSAHWFWLGGSIIGFRGGNDRLWLHGFGSESGSKAGEWDRQKHHVYLPLEGCVARLGCYVRSDDELQIKLEEVVGMCAVVLGDETLFSIKEYADDDKLLKWFLYKLTS